MCRRIIQDQYGWLIHIATKIIYRVNQELAIDIGRAFISHAEIVRSKDTEQIHLLIALREDLNALAPWRPPIGQARIHRKGALITKIQINSPTSIQLPDLR